jgi:site-specific DNA recombinase
MCDFSSIHFQKIFFLKSIGMVCIRQLSVCKKYEYLYYECKGHSPLSVGRTAKCTAKLVRADRLDAVVWYALCQLLHNPRLIPQLHQTWAEAKQHTLSGLEAQQAQLVQRRQRMERQDQRLLDAYQAEIIHLHELQTRRQKLAAELHQIVQASRQLAQTRHQSVHWQQVMDNTETFRQLLGENLAQLSFEERQTIAQCLISKVIVTGEAVDIQFVLPFASTPQVSPRPTKEPEGTPGHFYRLRLAHFYFPPTAIPVHHRARTGKIPHRHTGQE